MSKTQKIAKSGYKENRKPWAQIECEYESCQRKKFYESQVRKNEKRVAEGLEPLPIEDFPTFAHITPQFFGGLARLTEKMAEQSKQSTESKVNEDE